MWPYLPIFNFEKYQVFFLNNKKLFLEIFFISRTTVILKETKRLEKCTIYEIKKNSCEEKSKWRL